MRSYRDKSHENVDAVRCNDGVRYIVFRDLSVLEYRLGVEEYLSHQSQINNEILQIQIIKCGRHFSALSRKWSHGIHEQFLYNTTFWHCVGAEHEAGFWKGAASSWDHTVLPVTRHKWTQPTLTPSRGRYSIYLPQRNGRLSWPRTPVTGTYRDGLPGRRRSSKY